MLMTSNNAVMRSKYADGMINNVDLKQTVPSDLSLHCLFKSICPSS